MSIQESRDYGLLERLADEFAERHRKGEKPTVQAYVDRHPSLAEDLRDMLPAMLEMEGVQAAVATAAPPPAGEERVLGDFRILREIGRGGMGVVYEAEQISLGRRVALKLLTQKLLTDAKQKRRFEREARAAAKLHHTNIVPVFGFGENDGTPFYVMQFIQGLGLESVIGELAGMGPAAGTTATINRSGREVSAAASVAASLLTGTFHKSELDEPEQPVGMRTLTGPLYPTNAGSDSAPTAPIASDSSATSSSSATLPGQGGSRKATYWQSVARVGAQVADALDYAHKQGIIHRDIKPSNLLLDMTGTVWVADFGLAKADDAQDLTHTGDILGTLRYMPPEAFEGKADARGDVYSLGLTLYEMLALKPAFDEKDRNRLIKQVTQAELPPLRKVRAEVPRDLETIVAKATERDVGRRYQTAGELADDLQRFIADEPIRARRETTTEAAWRWARRHPGTATLAGAILFLMVGVTVASVLAARHFDRLAKAAEQTAISERTAKENEAKERAEANRLRQEADRQIARQYTEAANRLQADGDIAGALLWNVKALEANPEQADAIRTRIGLMLPQAPLPIHTFFHEGATRYFEIDPQGRTVALVMVDEKIHFYDLEKGTRLHTLADLGPLLRSAYSRDGTKFLTVHAEKESAPIAPTSRRGDETETIATKPRIVRLWDVPTGKVLIPPIPAIGRDTRDQDVGRAGDVCFCLGDTRIAVPISPTAYKLFDTSTGKEVETLPAKEGMAHQLINASADGRRLILQEDRIAVPLDAKKYPIPSGRQERRSVPVYSVVDLETLRRWEPALPDAARKDSDRFAQDPWGGWADSPPRFSPDGRFVLRVGNDVARLFDSAGKQLWQWDRPDEPTGRNARPSFGGGGFGGGGLGGFGGFGRTSFQYLFSADGRILVYTDSKGTHVLETAAPSRQPFKLATTITQLNDLGPRGQFLLATTDGRLAVFDTAGGRLVNQLPPSDPRGGATFSPDGQHVLLPAEGAYVKLVDASTGGRSLPLLAHEAPVSHQDFTPDGSRLVTRTGTTLRIWPLSRAERAARTVETEFNPTRYFTLSPDGGRIVISKTEVAGITLQTIDAATGKTIHEPVVIEVDEATKSQPRFRTGLFGAAFLGFSPSGERLLIGQGTNNPWGGAPGIGRLHLYDLKSGKLTPWPAEKLPPDDGYWSPSIRHEWSPGGEAALCAIQYTVSGWQGGSGRGIPGQGDEPVGPPKPIPDRPTGFLSLRSPEGKPIGEPIPITGRFVHAWSQDGRFLAVCSYGKGEWKTSLWDFQAGKPLRFLRDFPSVPDARTVVFEDQPGLQPVTLLGISDNANRLVFSHPTRSNDWGDGLSRLRYGESIVRIWDISTGKQVGPLERLEKTSNAPLLSPDGSVLYAALEVQQNPGVQAIEVESGKPLTRLMVPPERMKGFTLSPDGKRVLTWGNKTLQLWDAQTGKLLPAPLANEGTLSFAYFSKNGKRILAQTLPVEEVNGADGFGGRGGRNSMNNDIRIWDAETGQGLLTGLGGSTSILLDEDFTRVVRGVRRGGSLTIHDLAADDRPVEKLRVLAEALAAREVSGGAGLVVLDAASVSERWAKTAADRGAWGAVATDSQWHSDRIESARVGRIAFVGFAGLGPDLLATSTSVASAAVRWHLDRFLLLNPDDRERRSLRAIYARQEGEWAKVVADLRDEQPGQLTAIANLTARGTAYAELGEWKKAKEDFLAYRQFQKESQPKGNNPFAVFGANPLSQLSSTLSIAFVDWKLGDAGAFKRCRDEVAGILAESARPGDERAALRRIAASTQFTWPSLLFPEVPAEELVKALEKERSEPAGTGFGVSSLNRSLPIPVEEALAYRQGKWDGVVRSLEPSFNAKAGCTIPECLFLAMAAKKEGRDELAKQALERAVLQIKLAEEDPSLLLANNNYFSALTGNAVWVIRIVNEILLREAEEVVRGGK